MWRDDKKILLRFTSIHSSEYYLVRWHDWCDMTEEVMDLLKTYKEKNYKVDVIDAFKDLT